MGWDCIASGTGCPCTYKSRPGWILLHLKIQGQINPTSCTSSLWHGTVCLNTLTSFFGIFYLDVVFTNMKFLRFLIVWKKWYTLLKGVDWSWRYSAQSSITYFAICYIWVWERSEQSCQSSMIFNKGGVKLVAATRIFILCSIIGSSDFEFGSCHKIAKRSVQNLLHAITMNNGQNVFKWKFRHRHRLISPRSRYLVPKGSKAEERVGEIK